MGQAFNQRTTLTPTDLSSNPPSALYSRATVGQGHCFSDLQFTREMRGRHWPPCSPPYTRTLTLPRKLREQPQEMNQ